ncbi:MAG: 30S ribosomal protein S8 [Bacilli bacterium]
MVNDTIADMLTRIRNANMSKSESVSLPTSKACEAIAKILKEEGFIQDYVVKAEDKKPYKTLTLTLKYDSNGNRVISGIKRISKPGLRVTVSADKLPRVLNGLGIAIISTSTGVLTDKDARKANVGGEVVAYVW